MTEGAVPGEVAAPAVAPVSVGAYDALFLSGALDPPLRPGGLASLDRFNIVRQIGAGGMGIVFECVDAQTKAHLAVKLLRPDLVAFPDAVRRFLVEAGRMHALSHPAILRVPEVVDRPRGPYYVMPFMEGGALSARVRPGHPLDETTTVRVARDVADALVYAHGKGILHRDVKPPNVLLSGDGGAYLGDFGLVRHVVTDTFGSSVPGQLEGTAAYMSPAVAAGAAEDTRCDIYSFGATLYEMLTGSPPYQGKDAADVVRQVLAGPPVSIRRLNPLAAAGLVKVVEACMARELRDRYAQMSDVLADLDRFARAEPLLGAHGRGRSQWPRRLALGAAAVCVAAGFTAVMLRRTAPQAHSLIVPTTAPSGTRPAEARPAPQTPPSTQITDTPRLPAHSATERELDALDPLTTDLHLEDKLITDGDLRHLARLSRLERLYLKSSKVTDGGLVNLRELKRLQLLSLPDTAVVGTGFANLKGLSALETVNVGDSKVNDVGVESIVALPGLRTLILRNTLVTDGATKQIGRAVALHSLDLWGTPITDAGLSRLAGLVNLGSLVLRGTLVTDSGLQHLRHMTKLARLDLRGTGVVGPGLTELQGFTRLTYLDLSDAHVDDSAMRPLSKLVSLKQLNLRGARISDAGLKELSTLKLLTSLDLTGTNVSLGAVESLRDFARSRDSTLNGLTGL